MELWELNNYILGYRKRIKEEQKNIIKTAYYTASFNNAKKSKSLKYYLDNIDNEDKKVNKKETKKQLDFAREMDQKIQKIQRKEAENNGI